MTCPHCGTDVPNGAARCTGCGAPRSALATGVPEPGTAAAGPDLHASETTGAVPPAASTGSGTHELDSDVTRATAPAGPLPTSTGGARHPQMLVAGQILGTRYHIIRLLGTGGMGAVYHAWDAELGVAVALKLIRADATIDPDAAAEIERQFKQELLLARQVTHKHVVRIHDLGDIEGVKYITMPYIQGADLATVLRKQSKLEVSRALKYVRQIVEGLVAAHDAGVVHRDLKPANIMIDEEDQALIMDFGIAGSMSKSGLGALKVVGTLAYMAPEQAQAKSTDQRADVYALGMMFREILVGRRMPGAGEQAVADLMKRIKEAPPSLRTIDETIPEPLDALVVRCVQPDPADRFQTSAELGEALAALDDNGYLRPIAKPVSPWRIAAAAAAVVATIGMAVVVVKRTTPAAPPKPIDPVSILVADFDNTTGDAVFEGALEQPLTIAMEGASFINTFPRTDAKQLAQTLKGGTRLDDATARLVAFRQGIRYVLAGDVSAKAGGGFRLRLRAVDPSNGSVLQSASADASNKGDVLAAVGTAAGRLRSALGDKAVDRVTPTETFTAGSLEAFREYTTAQDLTLARRDEEALPHYRRAVELDPKFGRAYSGIAVSAQRLGSTEEAEAAWKTSLSLTDRMTEREKFRTFGNYYLGVVQNYEKAAEQFSALVKAYPADDAGFGNLALAHFYLHDFPSALAEVRRAVAMNPKNMLQRNNLALYAMYAGDFAPAAAEARKVIAEQGATASTFLPLVMEAVAKNDVAAAAGAYDEMAKTGARGASLASLGRGELALYGGRLADAESELKAGLAVDVAARSGAAAALKQITLAEGQLAAGRKAQAIEASHAALARTRQLGVIVPAARVLIRAGRVAEARALASELEGQLQKQNRAYGKILLAEIALEEKKFAEAIDLLTQARPLADVWLGRFDLGVAYLQADAYAEALPELEACQKRRGEATALFFDERPTVRYLATLPYWMGVAEAGMNVATAKSRFEAFLNIRKDATADPLVLDARRRVSGL